MSFKWNETKREISLPLWVYVSAWAHSVRRRAKPDKLFSDILTETHRSSLESLSPPQCRKKWCWMTLRMFALIMPKPVCVCVRSWTFNPAYIPGPDINTVLESRGARLAVMLEESSLCSTLCFSWREREGGRERICTVCWIYSGIQLYWISVPARPGQKEKHVCVCHYHNQTFSSELLLAGFMSGW